MSTSALTATCTPAVTVTDSGVVTSAFSQAFSARLPIAQAATNFVNGSGALAITKAAYATVTLASTTATYDLTALSSGTFKGDLAFAAVKGLFVFNNASGTGKYLLVGNAAATSFQGRLSGTTTTEKVDAGTPLYWITSESAGWDCTTNKNLKIDSGSNTITFDLLIIGN